MTESPSIDQPPGRIPWWREPSLLAVILLAAFTYFARLYALPLFGEEPRRALIAREMVETGDWIVPTTQGVLLLSRPPLQNWLIAITGLAVGSIDVIATRLPSILSTIAVTIMIYGYLRQRNTKLGSTAGAVSFATMLLVMEFARSGETEAVFTVFVAASMLLWHWGWMAKWPAWQMWSIGYACAALGMLTKGLQAPVYFAGSAGIFLVLTGNWRHLLTRGHLIGIAVFLLVFGAWQAPFTWMRGIEESWMMFFGDVAGRFVDRRWSTFLSHLVAYPVELLCVRLMPWSVLLLAFANRHVRSKLGERRETALFMTICILFSFVFVWLPPGSKVRYYMPLFPNFAVLIGIAVDCLAAEMKDRGWGSLWKTFVRAHVALMLGTAVIVLIVSLVKPSAWISLPLLPAFGFTIVTAWLAFVTQRSLSEPIDRGMARGVYGIGIFLALVQIGLITTVQEHRCQDIAGPIQQLKQTLPAGTKLVSLGLVHHAFAFFYQQPIPIVEMPVTKLPEGVEYFCLHTYATDPPELPFEWKQLAVINCDRFQSEGVPKDRVFIGHYTPAENVEPKRDSVPAE
ncbi:ArnT family glycosyltransferase [Schlesneria paludicola]|uniref:ArnT family glycosyltransferase n=1 Tax=Schlesneria paludicola TaxID=360056 RepID=UPI00029A62C6|nr:glycosyltransferase family 39 protein [Schlesneria paludicola]